MHVTTQELAATNDATQLRVHEEPWFIRMQVTCSNGTDNLDVHLRPTLHVTCILTTYVHLRLTDSLNTYYICTSQAYTTRTPAVHWRRVLTQGIAWIDTNLPQLEQLTKWRILSTSQVLVCTIDSVSRMLGDIEEAANESQAAGYRGWTIDEGACFTTLY
jgi:hypothetical protein